MTESKVEKRRFAMTRRRLILGGSLVGGALVVGYTATHPMQVAGAILQGGGSDPEPSVFGPFVRIGADDWVTVVNKHQEMGQGIHTALAAMVAEELDADWDRVRVVDARGNFRAYGPQLTAGSNSVASNWDTLRNAGAAARTMFVAAAAARWGVSPQSIAIRDSIVSHTGSGRSATFAELLTDASRQTPPQAPELKQPEDYRLIGTDRVRRKDTVPKITGGQVYTQDVDLPDMLVAMVAHSPRFGGKLARFDASDALKIPAVVDAFAIETGVAVVAENTFAARRGRDALRVEWDDSKAETRSTPELFRYYHEVAAGRTDIEPNVLETKGHPDAQFGSDVLEFTFDFPYLAHAPLEPMNCVAQIDGWDIKIMSGTQLVTLDQVHAARIGLTIPGKVDIEVLPAGGSFGRRGTATSDFVVECLRIARHTNGRPVKLIWTREDDMAGGFYRPMVHHRAWIELGPDGFPARWRHHVVSQEMVPIGGNFQNFEGITGSPYFVTASVVDGKIFSPSHPVQCGFWRSVGLSHTGMVMEHIIDQLARQARRDPADYRWALYQRAGAARHLAVLNELCLKSGWGSPIETGWARGMAITECFGTVVGQVAEVRIQEGRPVVRKVTAVVDCGIPISPDQIAAQMEGSIGFGLTAALYGAVTLKDGFVQETNFDSYPILRMNEMPTVETHIIRSANRPTGMGEPGVPPIAPAVANAMLILTGSPTTSLPILSGNALGNSNVSVRS
ncbi:molybdopterin cofactor-binding domain-containing protein [Rhizobium sp. LC145]|uniref:xanthine dehydrogenase family protein molybdopterin-binding subunit n=1 Tax=Rhizobium sp. LC145 TaxID=1120688 RepID=UPI00062A43CB|nr:molybdopterin cofactor-binding domain-containing protein [Rhizobium sp. LC145]KKX25097.1 isoquinoline 1-oxidoreductase [Rhizobium sp. LC145]TKT55095.1 xanthine dehydrogenase family protein molybdopterin-binding subunit [Rhizobiaceae bacterium LC148]